MAIDSKIPQISALRKRVEVRFGEKPSVHARFEALCDDIFAQTKEHMSVTTLERLWGYSTRISNSVSLRTLDVLCHYAGESSWAEFRKNLKESAGEESDMFDVESVKSENLECGKRLRIGWQPDRICVIRHLGNCRFVAEETQNAKMKPGDTFSCLQFQLHSPLYLENFSAAADSGKESLRYAVGLKNGLTMLEILE